VNRSTELAALLREHHVALELALRLRCASEDEVEPLAGDACAFWRRESMEHFRLEEEFLLQSLAGARPTMPTSRARAPIMPSCAAASGSWRKDTAT
jgi:hypothetical protein